VKFRPDDTTSERQLVLALAARGRQVPLGQLMAWRKDGLLPPLASSGTGNGRSYYWREPDILAWAELVHDALARHGRADATLVSLWLRGFPVGLRQLRRAWQHQGRQGKPLAMQKATAQNKAAPRAEDAGNPSDLVVKAFLRLGDGLVGSERLQSVLLPLLKRFDLGQGTIGPAALATLTALTVTLLGHSDLVRGASDGDLMAAQRHMRSVLDVLERDGAMPRDTTEVLGPGLFLVALGLLQSGNEALLAALLAHLPGAHENGAGRKSTSPVIGPYQITA